LRFTAQQDPHFWLPALYPFDKKFNWRTVTPTFREIKPFDELVEGLSHCGDKSYAATLPVQSMKFPSSVLAVLGGDDGEI